MTFGPGLIFVGKDGAYPSGAHYETPIKGLLANISQG